MELDVQDPKLSPRDCELHSRYGVHVMIYDQVQLFQVRVQCTAVTLLYPLGFRGLRLEWWKSKCTEVDTCTGSLMICCAQPRPSNPRVSLLRNPGIKITQPTEAISVVPV
jgi:hypothetical protein